MFRFIHAADLHLDSPLKGLEKYENAPVAEIRQATRRALENLVGLALEERIDFLLIAGDLYDGNWPDFQTGLFFAGQMARLNEAGIPVILIRGNHDAENKMTRSLNLPKNVTLLPADRPDTVDLKELRVAIHGQSFAEQAVATNLAAGYPDRRPGSFNIGLLHTCAGGDTDHAPYAPCSVTELADKGYDYWALGHVHDRRCLNERPPIWFSGNLQGRHPKETGAKGCLLVEVNERGGTAIDFRPVDVFRWEALRLNLSEVADEAGLLQTFREALETACEEHGGMPLAVRVFLDGPTPLHRALHADREHWLNQLRAEALDAGRGRVWIEKLRIETAPPPRALEELPDDGPIGELRAYLHALQADGDFEPELKELAGELDDLRKKLPRELRGDGEFSWDDAETMRLLLADVETLLLARLQRERIEA